MRDFAFVLEDSLGHSTHASNLKTAIARAPGLRPWVIDIHNRPPAGIGRLPGARNWSFRASLEARRRIGQRLATAPVEALFVHTQVASLLLPDVMKRVPTIVSMDATPANMDEQGLAYGHPLAPAALEAVKSRINRRAFLAARRLVTWSEWARHSLVAHYGVPETRVEVIHPGVDLARFGPSSAPPAGRPRLLFVGGDFTRKGGGDLLDAMRVLGPIAEVDIVTSARVDVPPDLPIAVHSGVRPNSPELQRLFAAADVFVLPTRGECFAQVIAEAMATALPVVATPVAAIPEMVQDGVNGYLVPPGAPRDLAGALRRLVEDGASRRRFGAASLRIARERHDAMANAARILALMESLTTAPEAMPA